MDADSLMVGSVILVRPGDRIAVDGVVVRGGSAADESMLTGEAAPIAKSRGDAVLGGTLNVGGSFLEVGRSLFNLHNTIRDRAGVHRCRCT